jgi:hypothetical protein
VLRTRSVESGRHVWKDVGQGRFPGISTSLAEPCGGATLASLGLALFVMLTGGCGKAGGGQSSPSTVSYTLSQAAHTIDAKDQAAVLSVSAAGDAIVLDGASDLAKTVFPGDVLVFSATASTPHGLLRKIVSKAESGGQLQLVTVQAKLEEAFQELHLAVHQAVDPNTMQSWKSDLRGINFHTVAPTSGGREIPFEGAQRSRVSDITVKGSAGAGFNVGFDNTVLYDDDNDPSTTYDQVVVSGSCSFSLSIDLEVDIGFGTMDRFKFGSNIKQESELTVETTLPAAQLNKQITLATLYFPPFAVGPVLIVPQLQLTAGVEGKLEAQISSEVSESVTLGAGILYQNGQWQPYNDLSANFDFQPPHLSASGTIKAHVGPNLGLLIYDAAGPYLQADGYLDLDADITSNPWWTLSAGVEGVAGAKGEVLGFVLLDYHTDDFIGYHKVLATAGGALLGAGSPDSGQQAVDGSRTPPGTQDADPRSPADVSAVGTSDACAGVPCSDSGISGAGGVPYPGGGADAGRGGAVGTGDVGVTSAGGMPGSGGTVVPTITGGAGGRVGSGGTGQGIGGTPGSGGTTASTAVPPGAPSPATPGNGATGVTVASPLLTWTAPAAGSLPFTYELVVTTDDALTNVAAAAPSVTTTSWAVDKPLTNSQRYFWRVRASNTAGAGPWSNTYQFTCQSATTPDAAPELPGAPTPAGPTNGATGVTVSSPVLTWTAPAAGTPLFTYAVVVAVDDALTNVIAAATGLTTTAWAVDLALANSQRYYWRVRANNVAGAGPWSSTYQFTCEAAASPDAGPTLPGAPILATPDNGATGVTVSSPALTWTAPATGTPSLTYAVVVAVDDALTNVIAAATELTTTSWAVDLTLAKGQRYYWRVRASNAAGTGPWSGTYQFTCQAAPTPDAAVPQEVLPDLPQESPSGGTPACGSSYAAANLPCTVAATDNGSTTTQLTGFATGQKYLLTMQLTGSGDTKMAAYNVGPSTESVGNTGGLG